MEADLDEMICPRLSVTQALELAERLYGLRGGHVTQLDGYDDLNFWLRPTEVAGNPHLATPSSSGYTLKVINSQDSLNRQFIEEQTDILQVLRQNGIQCPRPVKNKNGEMYSIELLEPKGPGHAVRLLEFVPGDILGKVSWHPDFAVQAGRELAKIDQILEELDMPFLSSRKNEWSLWAAPSVLKYLDEVLEDDSRRSLVREVLTAFTREVQPECPSLESDSALIHGDYNQFNIIVTRTEDGTYRVSGVLDLGDCHRAPRVFEVALAGTYMAILSGDINAIAGVVQGYSERKKFQCIRLLKVCIGARLCQSLIMSLRAHQRDPQNTYVLDTQVNGWQVLQDLWNAPPDSLEKQWEDIQSRVMVQQKTS